MERIVALDVGTVNTRAILLERHSNNGTGDWRFAGVSTSRTTAGAPNYDVMVGVREAISGLGQETHPAGFESIAVYSAGGGVRMLVAGLRREITGESAHRAALSAGGTVSKIFCLEDLNLGVAELEHLNALKPDVILLTGGTEGGNTEDVVALAEFLAMAAITNPQGKRVPVVYAGNHQAAEMVQRYLGGDTIVVDNIRPKVEVENLDGAREAIGELFRKRIARERTELKNLAEFTSGRLDTAAVGFLEALELLSQQLGGDVLGIDAGGGTLEVLSIISGRRYRTSSPRLELLLGEESDPFNYKLISQVMRGRTRDDICDACASLAFDPADASLLRSDPELYRAIWTVAVRKAFAAHVSIVRGLKGIKFQRGFGDIFNQVGSGGTMVDLKKVSAVVVSGGVFGIPCDTELAARIVVDALRPMGVTDVLVDSEGIVNAAGSLRLFGFPEACRTLLSRLVCPARVVSVVGAQPSWRKKVASVEIGSQVFNVTLGEIQWIPVSEIIPTSTVISFKVTPYRGLDVGQGPSASVSGRLLPNTMKVLLDGRPIEESGLVDSKHEAVVAP